LKIKLTREQSQQQLCKRHHDDGFEEITVVSNTWYDTSITPTKYQEFLNRLTANLLFHEK